MPTKTAKSKSTSAHRTAVSSAAKSRKGPAKKKIAAEMGTRKGGVKKVQKASPFNIVASKKTSPKTAVKASKPKTAAVETRSGFMWKALEQKRARQQASTGKPMPLANPFARAQPRSGNQGFGRFHGPRRKAA